MVCFLRIIGILRDLQLIDSDSEIEEKNENKKGKNRR